MSTQETIVLILAVIALVFALVDEITAQGRSLTAWAVILLSIALIYQSVA
jgi:hypothetical protein